MKESKFIDQNKEKWKKFERHFENKEKDPEQLSDLFIEVTNDLSYARSNYPNRSIKLYLNNLSNTVFTKLYRNKLRGWKNIAKFWQEDLPKVMYESRRALLVAFLLFTISFALGMFSSIHDGSFARLMLGDNYISMTESFIEEGDPMKVYKEMDQFDMFSYIALNNLIVSFRVFVLGVLFAIGTVWQLVYEGFRIGAFQYFFVERDLFWESFLTVWMHGAPEISSIILAGAAGLTLGGGLIFPGTYSRSEAFLQGARRGIMIMIGIVPILIYAALIEGFVTRMTELNDIVRGTIIFSHFAIIIYYFAVYPYRKFHKSKDYKPFEDKIPTTNLKPIELNKMKLPGQIYTESFSLFTKNIGRNFKISLFFTGLYLLSVYLFHNYSFNNVFTDIRYYSTNMMFNLEGSIIKLVHLFEYGRHPMLYAINSIVIGFLVTTFIYFFIKHVKKLKNEPYKISPTNFLMRNIHKVVMYSFIYNMIFFMSRDWTWITLILVMPLFFLASFVACYERCNPITGLSRATKLMFSTYGNVVGIAFTVLLMNMIMMIFINSGIVRFLIEGILMAFEMSDTLYTNLLLALVNGITFLNMCILLSTLVYSYALFYFSAYEKLTARDLLSQISTIASKNKAYGLPTED